MEIITLDPHGGRRGWPFCVARNDVARRRGNMMLGEKFDHPVTVSVADRARRIHHDRASILGIGEAIKHCAALAHREQVCAAAIKRRDVSASPTQSMMARSSSTRPGEWSGSR